MEDKLEKLKFSKASGKQTVVSFKQFQILRDTIIERTDSWARRNGFVAKELSPKAEEISRLLTKQRGRIGNDTLMLLSACFSSLLEEDVPLFADVVNYDVATIVVFTHNRNSHNYGTNNPTLMDYSNIGFRSDGSHGNNPPKERDSVRPATEEEIGEYMYSLLRTAPFILESYCERFRIPKIELEE